MDNILLLTAGRLVKPLFGTGVGRLPGVSPVYKMLWRRLGPRGIAEVTANGYTLLINYADWAVAPSLVFSHCWEPSETMLVKEHLRPGMAFVDIGAHVGYYSLLASSIVGGEGRVHAFEPNPESASLLRRNRDANAAYNVTVNEVAVTDRTGAKVTLHVNHSPASSGLFSVGRSSVTVGTVRLDSVISCADFVKMDVEGAEPLALRGMVGVLQNSPSLKMLTEIFPEGLRRAGSSGEEYMAMLKAWFDVYLVKHGGKIEPTDWKHVKAITDRSGSLSLFCVRRND